MRWRESERLEALRRYRVLDTPPEPAFDDLAQLASRACEAPVGLVTLVDDHRQWFKAEIGLGVRQTPLDQSVCATVMLQPGLTVVPDLTQDPRFKANPLVTGQPHLRFYAGVALMTPEGLPLGSLCVLDYVPREVSAEQASTLTALARQAMSQLELRRAITQRDEALEASRKVEQRQALLVRELHHRVRNTLAVVQSLLGATARRSESMEEFYHSFSGRIASLARTQAILTEDYWQTASLQDMARAELKPFGEEAQPRFALHGPSVELNADLAVPLGMAIHELASNAVKFGALSAETGQVELTWDVQNADGKRKVCLEWTEQGGPPVHPPEHAGFGATLLTKVLPRQVDATVDVQFRADGLRCRIEAPLPEQRHAPEH